ncbi:MAG: YkgJ family cysteine cluster protein, partial [Pseudoalteromonas sp.]
MPHIVTPSENIIPIKTLSNTPEPVTCANCQACCCQLEV